MTSSDSWNCDGIPKNGKKYPGLGGEHPEHSNYSLDCEVCGLPKESQDRSKKSRGIGGALPPIAITLAGIAVAGVVVVASGAMVYRVFDRDCEAGLEKVADECVDPFVQTYENATDKGDEAVKLADSYQNIRDLETARSNLTNAVTDLSEIPSEALIYDRVEPKLEEYKGKKTEVSSILDREKTAKEQIDDIVLMVQDAKETTESADTTTALKTAKQQWEKVNEKLQEINATDLIKNKITRYQQEYERQIKNIDREIAVLVEQNRPKPTPQPIATPPTKTNTAPKITRPFIKKPPVKTSPPKQSPQVTPTDPCAVDNPPANCRF